MARYFIDERLTHTKYTISEFKDQVKCFMWSAY